MRQFKKMSLMMAVLLLLLSVGCGKSASQRVKNASDNLGKVSSLEAKVIVALNMNVTASNASTPVDINLNADIVYFKSPMAAKVLATAALPAQSLQTFEMYVESGAQNMAQVYIKQAEKWSAQTIPLSSLAASTQSKGIDIASMFKSVKVVGSEEINGVKTDKIDCVLDEEKAWNAIMTASGAGVLLSQNQQAQQMAQLINSAMKGFTIQYWIAQNEDRIVQMKIDMTQLMQMILMLSKGSVGGMLNGLEGTGNTQTPAPTDVSLSQFYILITFEKMNSATPIQIPGEARTAVQN